MHSVNIDVSNFRILHESVKALGSEIKPVPLQPSAALLFTKAIGCEIYDWIVSTQLIKQMLFQ